VARGRVLDERLLEAGLILSSELSLPVTLQRIVELAAEVTGARYGALGVLGADGTITEFVTTGVTEAERAAIGQIPVGRGILGVLIEEAAPLRLDDLSSDPRSVGFPPNHPPMRSFLGAPVKARGRVFGNVYLTEKQDAEGFDGDDERALVVLAAQAGVAIENARLYEEASDRARRLEELTRQLDRLAVLEDRERIAKELHDGAIQALFAVGMGLQGAATLARDPELAGRIEGAVEELDRVIRDLRNYIFGLRPGILADRQLDQALRRLVEEFAERSGVVAVAEVDPEAASVLAGSAGDVVQLAREALSNVSRHAAATCRVSLRQVEGGVVLEVDDDGRGFDPDQASAGHGLPNLRERAAAVGGRAEIASAPGEGTTVRVTIPR
jgi:signal transduction histidine kinase